MLDKEYARDPTGTHRRHGAPHRAPGESTAWGHGVLCVRPTSAGRWSASSKSNYLGFGSGIVVPGPELPVQNHGANFWLDPNRPNVLAPGQAVLSHHPCGISSRAAHPVGPFGVMGGFMQPQGHLQVVLRTVDQQLHPQAALDAPRWRWEQGRTVWIEYAHAAAHRRRLATLVTVTYEESSRTRGIRPRPDRLAHGRRARCRFRFAGRRPSAGVVMQPFGDQLSGSWSNTQIPRPTSSVPRHNNRPGRYVIISSRCCRSRIPTSSLATFSQRS